VPSTRRSAMSRPGPRGSPSLERIRPREGERAGSSCEAAFSTVRVHVLQLPYLFDRVQGALPMKHSIIALAAALAASSALAAQDDYPPGLFENSPVVPSGPPNAVAPSQPPDAVDSFGPPDAVDPLDGYCEGLASRTFRSMAEVKRAHAKCDHARDVGPLWPPAEDQSDE
jgi:hypothetical protein